MIVYTGLDNIAYKQPEFGLVGSQSEQKVYLSNRKELRNYIERAIQNNDISVFSEPLCMIRLAGGRFDASGYGPYKVPSPVKYVSDNDQSMVWNNKLEGKEVDFVYDIIQRVPLEIAQFRYQTFVIEDVLPEGLTYVSSKVYNDANEDITSKFRVDVNGQTVTLNALNPSEEIFYDNTYDWKINVKATGKQKEFKNTATLKITRVNGTPDDEKESNEVITTRDYIDIKGKIVITKKDNESNVPLSGVTFGVYARDAIEGLDGNSYSAGDKVAEVTTGAGGVAEVGNLAIGKYYIVEESTINGYLKNNNQYDVVISEQEDVEEVVVEQEITDQRVKGTIEITKTDVESGAKLSGVVFGIYAKESISKPDGSGNAYEANNQVTTVTTGADGVARAENLYLGKYYIVEESTKAGYLRNT